MSSRLNPYLSFDGTARQALTRYREIFGGDVSMHTFGDSGVEGPDAEKLMHGMLETPSGYTVMCADSPTGMDRSSGSSISVSLSGDDAEELRGYFAQLSDGGTVTMPLAVQVWGDEFGMCTDAFGIPWMVNITSG